MLKVILPAAIASIVAMSAAPSAWAQPPVAPITSLEQLVAPGFIQVDDRRDRRDWRRRSDNRHRYTMDRRYDSERSGWHRYSRRPGNWQSRGCVMAGPVWLCR